MKKRITRLSILQTGIFMAVLYGLLALIFIPFFIAGLFATGMGSEAMGFLFMLVLYPVMGFIGGIICAFIFNVTAKFTGGFEYESSEVVSAAVDKVT